MGADIVAIARGAGIAQSAWAADESALRGDGRTSRCARTGRG